MNQNYNNTIEQLYGKLPDYLESMGIVIDSKGFFSCIHPDHPDKNPSCSLNYGNVLENKVFHCFSRVGHDGNIFTAAHWLENLPLQGADFWNITVKTLCKRYDIEFSALEVDEDTRRRFQAQRAQTDSARIIKSMSYDGLNLKTSHIGIKHLLDRGITEKSIRDFNIGVLSSFKEYVDAMFKLGHTDEEFLYSKGLMNKSIFNRDSFIIPIQNLKNQTVGFVSRNCRHDPNDHVNQKYVNSPNSDIYKKGEILFGYNSAIKHPGTLYIVEGYLDCMMMKQAGLEKVTALGSTVLTEKHVDILFDNETDLCLCLDADKGGEDGTKLAIERLGVYSKFTIKIIDLPKDYDPDKFINEFGLDEFLKLEKLSPFMWSLKHSTYADDLTVVAQKMIPIIAADQSSISRLRMIKDLSNFTGISETDIKSDVDALVNKEDSKYVQELQDINQFVQIQLSRSRVSDTKSIIREAYNKIDILSDKYHNNKDLRLEYFHELESLQNKIITGEYKYGLSAPNFKMLEKTLDGIPYWANLMLLAGRPSSGKTCTATALSMDIIEANPDAAIFYMSIDDTMTLLSTKMLAVRSGLSTTEIRSYNSLTEDKQALVDEAMGFLKGVSDRYIIADTTKGNSVDTLENHVKWFCKEFKNHKKLFFLDNFHKLQLEAKGMNQKKDVISDASSRIKDIADINDINIIATVELRKLLRETDRPTRQDMQGSNKLDYDATVVGLVHNDLQVNETSEIRHIMEVEGEAKEMPYIEVNIAKNKINGRIGTIPLKFNTHNMRVTEGNHSEWIRLKNKSKKRSQQF